MTRNLKGGQMTLERLLELYLDAIKSGDVSQLHFGQRAGLRAFCDWADRRGYEIIRQVDDNGAAVFCARCGGFISPAAMSSEPKGQP